MIFKNVQLLYENFENSIKNKSSQDIYYYLCYFEQLLNDIPETSIQIKDVIKNIKKEILIVSIIYFNNISSKNLDFSKLIILKDKLLEFQKLIQPKYFKEVESLAHFGFYPEDFFLEARKKSKNIDKNALIIGIRSAGSFFAPAITSGLNLENYYTIRLDKNLCELKSDNNDIKFDKYFFEEINEVVIVDEGPGTGETFNKTINILKKIKNNLKITIFHTRNINKSHLKIEASHKYIVKKAYIKNNIMEYMKELKISEFSKININEITSYDINPKNNYSLKNYESPKYLIREKNIIIKFLGYGPIGKKRYEYLLKLKLFFPKFKFYNGLIITKNIQKKTENKNYDLKLISEYFYQYKNITKIKKINYSEYIDFILFSIKNESWKLNTFNIDLKTFSRYFKKELKGLKCNFCEIDWKLERNKWIINKDKINKFDNFHTYDYGDLPPGDEFIHIAGFSIEFNLSQTEENELLKYYLKESNSKKKIEIIINLNKLIYLLWKLNYLNYIIKNLEKYAYDYKALERQYIYYEQKINIIITKFKLQK